MLIGFGMASGAPKKQPAAVQVRLLPVCSDVVGPMVATGPVHAVMAVTALPRSGTLTGSGTKLPPPPV